MESGTASRGAKSTTVAPCRQDGRQAMDEQGRDGKVGAGSGIEIFRLERRIPCEQLVGETGRVPRGLQLGVIADRGVLDRPRNRLAVFPHDVAVEKIREKAEVD